MIEMVQYGADKIFKSKGSTVTDQDIDSILSASKKTTEQLTAEWEKKSKKDFKQFSMEFNYQRFEGEDFTKARKEKVRVSMFAVRCCLMLPCCELLIL